MFLPLRFSDTDLRCIHFLIVSVVIIFLFFDTKFWQVRYGSLKMFCVHLIKSLLFNKNVMALAYTLQAYRWYSVTNFFKEKQFGCKISSESTNNGILNESFLNNIPRKRTIDFIASSFGNWTELEDISYRLLNHSLSIRRNRYIFDLS